MEGSKRKSSSYPHIPHNPFSIWKISPPSKTQMWHGRPARQPYNSKRTPTRLVPAISAANGRDAHATGPAAGRHPEQSIFHKIRGRISKAIRRFLIVPSPCPSRLARLRPSPPGVSRPTELPSRPGHLCERRVNSHRFMMHASRLRMALAAVVVAASSAGGSVGSRPAPVVARNVAARLGWENSLSCSL